MQHTISSSASSADSFVRPTATLIENIDTEIKRGIGGRRIINSEMGAKIWTRKERGLHDRPNKRVYEDESSTEASKIRGITLLVLFKAENHKKMLQGSKPEHESERLQKDLEQIATYESKSTVTQWILGRRNYRSTIGVVAS